jgi:hypothetical protein
VDSRAAAAEPAAIDAIVSVPTRSPAAPSPRARGRAGGEIAQGETYRVVRGAPQYGIAARNPGRPVTIPQAADAVFAANPDAFARGDRNLLEAGRPIVIPVMASNLVQPLIDTPNAPAPETSEVQPTTEAAPTVATPPAIEALPMAETLPAATAVADDARTAPAAAPNLVDAALAPVSAPTETTPLERNAPWLTALSALGAVVLVSAGLAFVRRRRSQPTASSTRRDARKAAPRTPVSFVGGIEVVESPAAPATRDDTATIPSTALGSANASRQAASSPTVELEPPIDPTGPVDIDVGVPVVMEERVDWFADRATAVNHTVVGSETVEENAATARVPDLDGAANAPPPSPVSNAKAPMADEAMTLTVTELDMLREDYEAEHTLTQQASKALQEAVADLEATKASLAATAETAELPQSSAAETFTARVRAK